LREINAIVIAYTMKNYFSLVICFLAASFSVRSQAIINLSNPLAMERTEEVISIPWKEIVTVYPTIDTSNFIVMDKDANQQVPYQLEHHGSPQIQHLLIQISMEANANRVLEVKRGKPAVFPTKTYCRYVPERDDDFAWENDKIAFRAYGQALENTIGNAYGLDVWVKRTDKLVIDERYKKGDYHVDHGDGLDYYDVGLTLGAGDIAPFHDDSIWYSKNYRNWSILDNGPLRSTFELEYDQWVVGSEKVKVVKTFSIDAGSQLHKVEASYIFDKSPFIPVAVGIVKRSSSGIELFDEQNGIMGYWEPADSQNGTTGVGCVFLQPVKYMMIKEGQLLSVVNAPQGEPVSYYRGAAWDKAGTITSAQRWFSYLQTYLQKLNHPVEAVVRKF